jgi:hypothetical protein
LRLTLLQKRRRPFPHVLGGEQKAERGEQGSGDRNVLQSERMRNTITVRLPDDLAEWLESTATRTGVSQGRIIREQLEKARAPEDQPFLHLAGRVSGPVKLSLRRGFSRK